MAIGHESAVEPRSKSSGHPGKVKAIAAAIAAVIAVDRVHRRVN